MNGGRQWGLPVGPGRSPVTIARRSSLPGVHSAAVEPPPIHVPCHPKRNDVKSVFSASSRGQVSSREMESSSCQVRASSACLFPVFLSSPQPDRYDNADDRTPGCMRCTYITANLSSLSCHRPPITWCSHDDSHEHLSPIPVMQPIETALPEH